MLTEEDLERRKRQRQEAADRLREMARAKREKQLGSLREAIKVLQGLQEALKTARGKELITINDKLQIMGIVDAKALPRALLTKVLLMLPCPYRVHIKFTMRIRVRLHTITRYGPSAPFHVHMIN
jgi:hypothetical protein